MRFKSIRNFWFIVWVAVSLSMGYAQDTQDDDQEVGEQITGCPEGCGGCFPDGTLKFGKSLDDYCAANPQDCSTDSQGKKVINK